MKKTASTVKKGANKKVAKTATTKAANAKTKVTSAKVGKKKAATTVSTVRGKAKKLVAKVVKAEHSAVDVAERIGSTMETIGTAILSIVKPVQAATQKRA